MAAALVLDFWRTRPAMAWLAGCPGWIAVALIWITLLDEVSSHLSTDPRLRASNRALVHDDWRILWLRAGLARMAWELSHVLEHELSMISLAEDLEYPDFEASSIETKQDEGGHPLEALTGLISKVLPSRDHWMLVNLGRALLVSHLRWYFDNAQYNDQPLGGIPPPEKDADYRILQVVPEPPGQAN